MEKFEAIAFVEKSENICTDLFNKSELSDKINIIRTENNTRYDAVTDKSVLLEFKARTEYISSNLPREKGRYEGTVWCNADKINYLASLNQNCAFICFFSDYILYMGARQIVKAYQEGKIFKQYDYVNNPTKGERFEENYHIPPRIMKVARYKE